ncbi:TrmH family RNA methyltransferase [Brevibacillus sp. SYSU BS000544]|uniref:TrmH family RNA methyltransferase n=1 Tax=Brevibacillus sp. SYSU BS000544 TaxID=3416443 RepID=UPI003CE50CB3
MNWETITSLQNPLVKRLHQLHQKKERDASGTYLIEGIHLVEEALRTSQDVVTLLFDQEQMADKTIINLLSNVQADTKLIATTPQVIEKLSDTKSPQGVIAEVHKQFLQWQKWWSTTKERDFLLLVLDEIQDPGNLGTMLRTADAAGVDGVILCGGNVDLYNGKVVRSTMGSLFRIPVFTIDGATAGNEILSAGGQLLVTSLGESSKSYDSPIYHGKIAIVIGNEGRGVSREMLANATETVHIPLYGGAESLNAAVATGIMLYEAKRQRANT